MAILTCQPSDVYEEENFGCFTATGDASAPRSPSVGSTVIRATLTLLSSVYSNTSASGRCGGLYR